MKKSAFAIILLSFFLCLYAQEDVFEDAKIDTSSPENKEEKIPPPPQSEIDSALAKIREIFAEKLKSPDKKAKIELGENFLEESKNTKYPLNLRYAFLSEAQKIFTEMADGENLVKSIELMAVTFSIDKIKIYFEKLMLAGRNTKTTDENLSIANAYKTLYDLCIEQLLFDDANNALNAALSFARKSKNKDLEEIIKAEQKDFLNLKRQYLLVLPSIQKLSKEPNNKNANLNVGKFYCFVFDKWEEGLLYLKNSDDEKFSKAATIELSNPVDPQIMLQLADLWWELSEDRNNKEYQIPLTKRACFWYENALSALEGLDKLRIEKRIQTAYTYIFKTNLEIPKDCIIALSFDQDTISRRGSRYIIRNLVGNAYNAIAHDVSLKKISLKDSVVEFDGIKSQIEIKNPREDLSKDFTLAMWLKTEEDNRRRNPYNKSYGAEGTITIETDNSVNFYFGSSGTDAGPYTSINCPNAVINGKWSHIAIVRDSSRRNVSIYLNGEKKAEKVYDFVVKSSEKDILIGSGYAGAFKGQIDDFILVNRALTDKEIRRMFKAGERKFQ
ncbi:MAG TPA: LamG domain-containing protein [Victivallales bacterium]|nr:LamG domain-containing protein [Victivallales bacterium]HPO91092.1 LamG domain-containing protein [Victivallales bacterium]